MGFKRTVSIAFSGIYFQLAWILLILLYHQYHSRKVWCHLWIWPFIDQMDPYCQGECLDNNLCHFCL